VVILCIPVVYFGVRFFGSLMDQALAGRKMSGADGKKEKRRRYGREDEEEQNDIGGR
jgi:hypothetical protein